MADWGEEDTKITEAALSGTPDRDRAYLIVLSGTSVGEMFKILEGEAIIGRSTQAGIRVVDEGISRQHARIVQEAGMLFIEDLGSKNGTFANGERITRHRLQDGDKIQVGQTTILKFTYHDHLDEVFQRQMYESALYDALTKIFNRKHFNDRLQSELSYSLRHQTPLSLLLLDIDHFKKINDQYGHLAGDFALQSMAATVSRMIRKEDFFARYGGEEFAILCRGIDSRGGALFAERVRQALAAASLQYENQAISITVSIGVAGLPHPALLTPTDFIGAADEALYRAKESGRNRVIVH